MRLEQLTSIAALRQFLEATQAVIFGMATNKQERYQQVQKTLVNQRYLLLGY